MKNREIFSGKDALAITVILATILLFLIFLNGPHRAARAVVLVHSKVYKVVPLNKNETFKVYWKKRYLMTIQVKSGAIRVKNSTCKRKICVHTGWISKDGQSIVCVPNRVIIYTEGAKSASCDLMTTQ